MNLLKILFLVAFIPVTLSAKLYSTYEVEQNEKLIDAKKVAVEFFTSQNPREYIDSLIQVEKSQDNNLYLEGLLYHLLEEVSFKARQGFLNEFVHSMRNYQVIAMKYHAEGRAKIPVYNISVKAKGIENIWIAAESLSYYQNAFEYDAVRTLVAIAQKDFYLPRPEFLGLKNSIDLMSLESKIAISQYLQKTHKSNTNLDRFIVEFILKTKDKNLTTSALKFLNKNSRELLQRSLSKVFNQEFVIEQLVDSIDKSKSPEFALSLLSPYVDNNINVQDFVIQKLHNQRLANGAVFVLSQSRNMKLINRLSLEHQKTKSKIIKNNIELSLKLNVLSYSKIVLKELTKGEVQ